MKSWAERSCFAAESGGNAGAAAEEDFGHRCKGRPRRCRRCLICASVAFVILLVLAVGLVAGMYPFLAPSAPAASEVLVLEGWIPDAPMEEALAWAATNGIQKIWVTGGPVETGSWLAPWKTYAEMTRARLEKMGATERFQVEAFPAPHTRKDRTLVSAMALKTALGSGRLPAALTLASEGPHTRRSRLLFRRALGPEVVVGSLALTPSEYEPRDWWKSSAGFRSVISEAIAYPYAVFFSPDP